MSSVYHQSHTEPNIYFQPPFVSGATSCNRSPAAVQNSRDETSEEISSILQRDTLRVIDEHLEKHVKKIRVLLTVVVSVIGVFLALAIGLAFLATIHSQKQLPLPDIEIEVTKHVATLQGNLTALNNQLIHIHAKQLNEYAQLTQQMNEYDQQAKTLNDITARIGSDLADYAQLTERLEDSIYQNRATIEQIRNNSTNLPSKFVYVYQ